MDSNFAELFAGTDITSGDKEEILFRPPLISFTKKYIDPNESLFLEIHKRNLGIPGSLPDKTQIYHSDRNKLQKFENDDDVHLKSVVYVSKVICKCKSLELFNTFSTNERYPVIIYDGKIKVYTDPESHLEKFTREKNIKDTFGKKWADDNSVIIYGKKVSYLILVSKGILLTNIQKKNLKLNNAFAEVNAMNMDISKHIQLNSGNSFTITDTLVDSLKTQVYLPVIFERKQFLSFYDMFQTIPECSKLFDISIIDMSSKAIQERVSTLEKMEKDASDGCKSKFICELQRIRSYKKNRKRQRKFVCMHLRNFPYSSEISDVRPHNIIRIEKGTDQYINHTLVNVTLKHSAEFFHHTMGMIYGILKEYQRINNNSLLKCEVRSAGKWERLLTIFPRMRGTTHCQKGFVPTAVTKQELLQKYTGNVTPASLQNIPEPYISEFSYTYAAPIPTYDLLGSKYENETMYIICPFDRDNFSKRSWYPGWNNLGEPCGFKEDQRGKEKWNFKYYIELKNQPVKIYPYKFDQLVVPFARFGNLSPLFEDKLTQFSGSEKSEFRRVGIITATGHYNTLLHSILYCLSDKFVQSCKKQRDAMVLNFRIQLLHKIQQMEKDDNMRKYLFHDDVKKKNVEKCLSNKRRAISHLDFQDILAELLNCNILILSYARDIKKNRKYTRQELSQCDMIINYGKLNPVLHADRPWVILFGDNDRGIPTYEPIVQVESYESFLHSNRKFMPNDTMSISIGKLLITQYKEVTDNHFALRYLISKYGIVEVTQIITEKRNVIAYYVPGKILYPLSCIETIYPRIGVLAYSDYITCMSEFSIGLFRLFGKESVAIYLDDKIYAVSQRDGKIMIPVKPVLLTEKLEIFLKKTNRLVENTSIDQIIQIDSMVSENHDIYDNIHIRIVRENIFLSELFHRFHLTLCDELQESDELLKKIQSDITVKEILAILHHIFNKKILIIENMCYEELDYRKLLIRTTKEPAFYDERGLLKITKDMYQKFLRKFATDVLYNKDFFVTPPDIYVYKDFICYKENKERILETFMDYYRFVTDIDEKTSDTEEKYLVQFKDFETGENDQEYTLTQVYLRSAFKVHGRLIQPCKADTIGLFRALSNCFRKNNVPKHKLYERKQSYMQWETVVHDVDALRMLEKVHKYLQMPRNQSIRSMINTMNRDCMNYDRILMKMKRKLSICSILEKEPEHRDLFSFPIVQFMKRLFHDSVIIQLICNALNISVIVYDKQSFPDWKNKHVFKPTNMISKKQNTTQKKKKKTIPIFEIFYLVNGEYHTIL